jgi:hypothetical protein
LYVYFFEQAFKRLLRKEGQFGVICSNKFMKAGYGGPLRQFLSGITLREVIDFGDSNVFPDATTYPTIIIAQNTTPSANHAVHVLPSENIHSARGIEIEAAMNLASGLSWLQPQSSLNVDGWALVSPRVLSLTNKLKQTGTPLGQLAGTKMNYGIKTGLNEAFVITKAQRDNLVKQNANSVDLIKPWIRGRDVKRWRIEDDDNYILAIQSSGDKDATHKWKDAATTKAAETSFKASFPAIYQHLNAYKKGLNKRQDQGKFWWELRACAYWQEFEKSKIVYPDISISPRFAYDSSGFHGSNTIYILPSDKMWLTGVLNSSVIQFFFEQISSSIRGDYLRFFTSYMEQLPLANITVVQEQSITSDVQKATQFATERLKLHRDTRHRFFDLDSKKIGKLSQALEKWWELPDFTSFQAAIKTTFKTSIPLSDRQSWEDYLAQQQAEHRQLTHEIILCEQEINKLVYQLYGLTQAEIQLIEQTTPYQYGAL